MNYPVLYYLGRVSTNRLISSLLKYPLVLISGLGELVTKRATRKMSVTLLFGSQPQGKLKTQNPKDLNNSEFFIR